MKVRGHVECLNPELAREIGVDKETSNFVIEGTEDTLGLAVLWRGLGAGESNGSTLLSAKMMKRFIIEFPAHVTLVAFDNPVKLRFDECVELGDFGESFGLVFKGENPNKVSMIIQKYQIKAKATNT